MTLALPCPTASAEAAGWQWPGGSALIIEPESPRDTDTIVVSYVSYGCGVDAVNKRFDRRSIDITVTYRTQCTAPDGSETGRLYGPGFYRRIALGRLPAGNYLIRLYRRDLDRNASPIFDVGDSFAVMPTR